MDLGMFTKECPQCEVELYSYIYIYNYTSIQHKPRLAHFKTHVPRGCHTWYPFAQIDPIIAITAIYPRHSGAIAAHFLDPEGPCDVIIFWGKQPSWSPFFSVFWVVECWFFVVKNWLQAKNKDSPSKKTLGFWACLTNRKGLEGDGRVFKTLRGTIKHMVSLAIKMHGDIHK